MNINYDKQGQGQTLVLFHGWGFDSRIWKPVISRLREKYEVYAFDLPGFGKTELMSASCYFQKVAELLPEQFSVLGWSLGGLWATRMACNFNNRVEKVINICSSPCFLQAPDWPGISSAVLERFYQQIEESPSQVLEEFIRLQGVELNEIAPLMNSSSKEGLKQGLEQLKHWDLREEIESLQQPVHYLFSRLDAITPYQTLSYMRENYPQFNYELFKRSAHVPFLSHPEPFIEYIHKVMI